MTNTYGDISPRTAAFAVKELLDAGQHMMVLERFGMVDRQSKNSTKVRKYRRYEPFARATAPLAEGIVPAGQAISYTDVTCTLEQYGAYVILTDVIEDTHEDNLLKEMSKLCGRQAAETIEVIRFNVLKGGTNVAYAGTATTRATVTATIARKDIHLALRSLRKNKAVPISEIVKASAKIATMPVASAFFGLSHTDMVADISAMTGFTPVEQYSESDKALPGEIGKVLEVRFVCTALFEPWLSAGTSTTGFLAAGVPADTAASIDVYPILIVAENAYAMVPLQGFESVDIGVLNPGKKTKDDPMGQKGYVSWKTYQTAAILNEMWIYRIECACTARPT